MIRALVSVLLAAVLVLPAEAREVTFAGHTWYVRDYPGGPGPNEWNPDDVFVDKDGLHLFIAKKNGVWTASEVVLLGPPLGFGTYTFEITGDLAALDTNAVIGLFNYRGSDDIGPDGTNEIDIEIAQWGDTRNPNKLNWNIYPSLASGEKGNHALPIAPGLTASTHRFTWTANSISYDAHDGYLSLAEALPIADWVYAPRDAARDIPQHPLVVHMNLWLVEGKPPSDGKPIEIVIRDFRFTPL
jgi:hypothetical protein